MQSVWLDAIRVRVYVDEEDGDKAVEDFQNALSVALDLINSCQRLVERRPSITQDMHLRQLRRVRNAIFRASAQNWGTFRTNFNEDFMMSLQWAAQDMSTHWYEETIPQGELAGIQSEIEALSERVVASGLDTSLKTILLDGLEAIRKAILDYRVTGADGIRQAVDSNIGGVARHIQEFREVSDNKDKEVVDAVLRLVNVVNKTVTVALKLKALGEGAIEFLSITGAGMRCEATDFSSPPLIPISRNRTINHSM